MLGHVATHYPGLAVRNNGEVQDVQELALPFKIVCEKRKKVQEKNKKRNTIKVLAYQLHYALPGDVQVLQLALQA